MNLVVNDKNGVVVVRIKEERVDAHVSDEFKKELKRFYEEGRKNVLVDMTDVRFIDSCGLGALVTTLRTANGHKGMLKLAALKPQVQALFELTSLSLVMNIFPTTAEALESDWEKDYGQEFT
jgi:anti-sigma B factor antagonist